MSEVIFLATVVPLIGFALCSTSKFVSRESLFGDRGVALQTVIVIVVLLAIGGAVAGVLLNRGGEAVAEAERQDITRAPSEFSDDGLCNAYGFYWSGDAATGTCLVAAPTTTTTKPASFYTVEADCTSAGYTWTPPSDPGGSCS